MWISLIGRRKTKAEYAFEQKQKARHSGKDDKKVTNCSDNLITKGNFPMRCHGSMLRLSGLSKFQGKAGAVTFTEFI